MAVKIGLKLWSTNTEFYLKEARRLFDQKFIDYIELYVVPNTLETLEKWSELPIPYILHNAHFAQGFNLALSEKRKFNQGIFKQTQEFARVLNSEYIIFHGGIDGSVDETIYQISQFNDNRILLENKPFRALPNRMGGKFCRGATLEEIKAIVDATGCGFCLDFGHAVCSANSQGLDPYDYILNLNEVLSPEMYHLSDVLDMKTEFDSHPHLGQGNLDIAYLCEHVLCSDTLLSIETNKNHLERLDDFEGDVRWLRQSL